MTLPICYTKRVQETATHMNYTVGAEIAYGRIYNGTPMSYEFSTIAHINGHGHVKLPNGLVFDKHGYERGGRLNPRYLMEPSRLREALDFQYNQQRRRTQINDIQSLVGNLHHDHSEEAKQRLISLINNL